MRKGGEGNDEDDKPSPSPATLRDQVSPAKAPEATANPISRLFFSWVQPLFRRASDLHKENKALELEDLLALTEADLGRRISPIFEEVWRGGTHGETEAQNGETSPSSSSPSLAKCIGKVIGTRFYVAGLLKVVNTSLQFSYPILLNAILKFIEDVQSGNINVDGTSASVNTDADAGTDADQPWYVTYQGYWLSALLFLAMACKAITENLYFHMMYRSGYQARVAISLSIYNKALRLTSSERHGTTMGEMVNLMQVDAAKIELFVPQVHVLWEGLLQIVGYITILYTLIGWPCFVGLGVMMLAGPVQAIIMKRLFGLNRGMVKHTDGRVKTTNEAIQGIRCVKMYTWEESFHNVISKSRQAELSFLKQMSYLRGFSRAYMGALPNIVAVASFVVYALAFRGNISASTLFAALIAFGQLRFPLLFYPMTLASYSQASVSAKRIEDFLSLKEVRNDATIYNRDDESLKSKSRDGGSGISIALNDVQIFWQDPNTSLEEHNDSHHDGDDNENEKSHNDNNSDALNNDQEKLSYPQPILSNVSLDVKTGELAAIIGRVGSGKSTLCSAILNEAIIANGSIGLHGTIAYAAQTPWILNATLRDNILFGNAFDQDKYDRVISACQLRHDLSLLDYGDMTEIGENGINLSGGQRQRVSIARAAYSEADIVILDDPLSALDPEVGKELFDECIAKFMAGKTRILVTNQLQFLQYCDTLIALDQGVISEHGTYAELSQNGGEVGKLLNELKMKDETSTSTLKSTNSKSEEEVTGDKKAESGAGMAEGSGALVREEERNIGAVSWEVYKKYFRAGGGFFVFSLIFAMFLLCAANDFLNTFWITLWTSDANYERQSQFFYLVLYATFSLTAGIFVFFRSMFLARFGVRASKELHKGLLHTILHAPMSFFDTTPTGRILSRFSKDLYSVDLEISDNMDFAIFAGLTVLLSIGIIIVVTPWFGIAVIPIMYIYLRVLNYFREVARETKRIESISRSPVFAHFSETLGGISTIQAYSETKRFIQEFELKVDTNTRATYNSRSADRWLSTRLELLGALIAGLAAVFACSVVINNTVSIDSGSSNFASVAGLSLNYAISVTGLLNWVVRTFAAMEATMNAAERILFYTEEIAQEAPATSKELNRVFRKPTPQKDDVEFPELPPSSIAVAAKGGTVRLEEGWPLNGSISFKNLKMRYRPENPLVLKGLSAEIDGGSRIGVVGRTGSGKSSLLLTILRIVEPTLEKNDIYEAPISIDGVDILRIGLRELRQVVGIIPQNPVLFSGTIRSNMDPFNEYTDEEIWNALEGCGMKSTVEEMSGIYAPIAEYGDNLSQGQRQLLCLGRALLKRCRILLLDEATSSVDYETDKEIQRTLREAFAQCTVLTIAHRVNTIMDSDKILVMVDGEVGEFASPDELLADNNSIFSDIVKHSQTKTST